jgi:2-alkenal reductase
MKRIFPFLAVFVAMALALLSCRTLTVGQPTHPAPAAQVITTVVAPQVTLAVPPPVDMISSQDTLVNLYRQVNPGIVAIRVLTQDGAAQGSGFVFDDQGHIVTNYHVVEGETDLEVDFPDGYKVRGSVIGTDLDSDLAVIKVDAPAAEVHALKLGDSGLVEVGQTVVAIGNPFGLQGTMTVGIISGLGRTVESQHSTTEGTFSAGDIIQTDAAINPGNSGGPLLNLSGEVIGINESIRTNSFDTTGQPLNSGVGFAISSNIVKHVVPFLIKDGKYDYPYLGIYSFPDLTLIVQEALGLPRSTGVYVTSVSPGGPAEKAGIRGGSTPTDIPNLESGGDLIIAIDGHPVNNYNDLIGYLVSNKIPGDKVVLTVLRGDEEKQLELTLDKRPTP